MSNDTKLRKCLEDINAVRESLISKYQKAKTMAQKDQVATALGMLIYAEIELKKAFLIVEEESL